MTPVQVKGPDGSGYLNLGVSSPAPQLTVTPSSLELAAGQLVQLTVTAQLSDGSAVDVTNEASYQSSDVSVAAVSSNGLVTAVGPGSATITIIYQELSTTVPVTVAAPVVESLTASPSPMALAKGQSAQLAVTAHFSDGSSQDVTNAATYSSSDTSVAAVSSSGLVTGVGAGNATITVAYQGASAQVPVTVAEASSVSQTGDIIVLKVPQLLQPVTYDCAAGFTVTENGIDVPVTRVEVKDGTDGWPYSEVWLYLAHAVTVGSNVVVEYWPDPEHPITPVSGGQVIIPGQTTAVNYSTVPFSITRGTIYVPESGDVVYIDLPTAVNAVDYQGSAGFVIHAGSVTIPVTRVVTEGTRVRLYPAYRIAQGTPVSVTYVPVSGYEITTVAGAPLVVTEEPVVIVNESTAPLVYYDPVVLPDGYRVELTVPADLGSGYYEGSMGFRVFSEGREIPVVAVEVDGNKIILYLGAPLIGGANFEVAYTPVEGGSIVGEGDVALSGSDPVSGVNQSELELVDLVVAQSALSLPQGGTAQLVVTARYSDGSTADVTALCAYQSSAPGVVLADETGLVSGVAPGSAVITVEYGGLVRTLPVTVSAVLESISVEPGSVTLPAGKTQQLIVTAHFSDGSTQDITSVAGYSSGNASVATVSNAGLVTARAQGNTIVTVTHQGKTAQVPVTVTAPALERITVSPSPVSVPAGQARQLTVTAHYSDGSTQDVTSQAAYESADTGVAQASSTGLVTGVAAGNTCITVTYQDKAVEVPVTVTAAVLESISVEPVAVSLAASRTQQLTVTAHYSDGTSRNVTLEAGYESGDVNVARVSAAGVVTGAAPGSTMVTVSYEGKTAQVPVTVTAPIVEEITVVPSPVNIPAGKAQQLTVTARYSDGSTRDVTSGAGYQSADTNVAQVSSSGLVTGKAEGATTVTVSYEGKAVQVAVVVTAPVVEGLEVMPSSVTLPKGRTQQLVVTAVLSDGSRRDVTGLAAYSSSNESVASASTSGLVTARSTGSAAITVSYEGKTVQVPVTVTAPEVESLTVEPSPVTLPKGKTQQLTVTAHLSDGSAQDVTSVAGYSSDNASVAPVSASGVVTGKAQGSATIIVTYEGKTVQVPVTVTAPVLEEITVAPSPVSLPAGRSQQLAVTARYSDGSTQDVTALATYQSANTGVAQVSATGLVTGAAAGNTAVTVTYQDKTVQVPVTVTAPVLESITVSPQPMALEVGKSEQLVVTAHFSDGSSRDVTSLASYQSANTRIAQVSSGGLVTGVAAGSTTITVSYQGKSVQVLVAVSAPPVTVVGLGVEPSPVVVIKGCSQRLKVYELRSDGTRVDVTQSSSYASSDSTIASVSGTGVVTGRKVGSAVITVTYKGMRGEVPVTVVSQTVTQPSRPGEGGSVIVVFPERPESGEIVVIPSER